MRPRFSPDGKLFEVGEGVSVTQVVEAVHAELYPVNAGISR